MSMINSHELIKIAPISICGHESSERVEAERWGPGQLTPQWHQEKQRKLTPPPRGPACPSFFSISFTGNMMRMTSSVGGGRQSKCHNYRTQNKMFIRGLQESEWLGPLQAAQKDEQKDSHSFALEITCYLQPGLFLRCPYHPTVPTSVLLQPC